jgi:hypothetical protein
MRHIFSAFILSFFLLSACAPATPKVPTILPIFPTAIPPTVTATATATPTPLPTPTITPIPGPPKGSVKTVDGVNLFIKNGVLVEMKSDGSTSGTSFKDHIFAATLGDKGKSTRELFKAFYPEYFEKGAAAKLLKLDKYKGNLDYNMKATKGTFSKTDGEQVFFTFIGVAIGPKLRVPFNANYSWRKPTRYGLVQMFATPLVNEPVPVLVGLTEDDGSEFYLTDNWRLINANGKAERLISTSSPEVSNCEGLRFQLVVLDKITEKQATQQDDPIANYFFNNQQVKVEQLTKKNGAAFLEDALKKLDGDIGLISFPTMTVYKD